MKFGVSDMSDSLRSRKNELNSFLHILHDIRAVAGSHEETYHYLEGIDYCVGWLECKKSFLSYPDVFDGGDSDAEGK